jgi:DNA (cytosine-5)-methyltransferase 1
MRNWFGSMTVTGADRPRPRRLIAISLFSGAGGLDLGFEAAGFQIAACLENDLHARQTLSFNRPNWQLIGNGDVTVANPVEVLGIAGLRGAESVLLAGPPCQPFSKSAYWSAGETRRMDDPRARTIRSLMNFVEALLPRALVVENVSGIAYRSKNEGVVVIKERLNQINERHGTNYVSFEINLNAAMFGVPQIRERLFLIAFRDGKQFSVPLPTHGQDAPHMLPVPTTWDAIGDLVAEEKDLIDLMPKGKWAPLLPSIPEGQNYLYHTDRGGGMPLFGWRTRYWSFLLKLSKHLPSWTLQADPGPATGPFHWDNRLLSVAEMKRLQTFPDDYQIHGNYQMARRQLGNAVPPAMAEAIARRVRSTLIEEAYSPLLSFSTAPRPGRFVVQPVLPDAVPEPYWQLQGRHAEHPGPGAGPGARTRALDSDTARLRRNAA